MRTPYTPTRTCPHPWCRVLHLVPLPFAIALLAFQMWNNWIYLVLLATGVFGSMFVGKLVHYKPTPRSHPATVKDVVRDIRDAKTSIDLEMEDAKYEGTGWRMLEVRRGWARVAVGCDIALLTVIGVAATTVFANPQAEARNVADDQLDAGMLVSGVIGLSFFAFLLYAHKKATQPRKPKRAWLPAALRMGGAK